jgi:hypothetical protein
LAGTSSNVTTRLLGARRAPAVIVALGLALAAPSLTVGLSADDWVHEAVLRGQSLAGVPRGQLDLFRFADGDPAHAHALIDIGMFPWWADPSVRLAFWRPLSALTHLADHAVHAGPVAMHAHSLVWFGLALVAVWLVYRRFLTPSWVAGLAFLLYAVDDAHGPPVGWIANRNAMVALAVGLWALWLHDRGGRARWLAPIALLLGLLAGESAIGVCAYLVAHAWFIDERPARARVLGLVPYAVVVVGWRVVYQRLGYGAAGSTAYLDPARDTLEFATALPARAAALLVGQLALPWSDLASIWRFVSPSLERTMIIVTVGVLIATIALLWSTVRRDRVSRFFAAGALLSVVPICSTFPADRLLWFVGIGAMAVVARFLASPKMRAQKVGAVALIGVHLVLAPLFLLSRSRSMETVERPLARANHSIPSGDKTVVIINPPSDALVGYTQITRAAQGLPAPRRLRWLATGAAGVTVMRDDDRTLRVRAGFLEQISERMLTGPRRRFAVGDRVDLTGLSIEVVSVADGRPTEVRFRFDVPLEDPSLLWLQWAERDFQPFSPPPVGGQVTLPPTDFLKAAFSP